MRSYLLLLRFVIFNVVALALFVMAWVEGWVTMVIDADVTRISGGIAAIFLIGFGICAVRVVRVSRELNTVTGGAEWPSRVRWYLDLAAAAKPEARANLAGCLRSRLYSRIAVVRTIANSLVVLGLIGTVIGFIIALSAVDPAAASDIGVIAPMVSSLIKGMAVALYTTLAGAVFHIWLLVDYQLLATGTVTLANAIIERSEAPAHFERIAAAEAAHG